MVSVSEQKQNKASATQTERSRYLKRLESTFVFLHGVRLNRCKRLLSREEETDLSFGLFVTGAAVKLIDRIVLYSELRSEADGGRTHTSAFTAVVSLFCSSCC